MRRTLAAVALLLLVATFTFAQNSAEGGRRIVSTYAVSVQCNVRGAYVYIDGERQWDRTPATFRLRAGTYTFRVESRGYETWEERITISGNQTIRVDLRPPVAVLVLRIPSELLNYEVRDPWRLIDVYVDGRLRYAERIEVEPGWREIAIVSGGLRLENEIYLEAGITYTVEMLLRMAVTESRSGR
jgi:hypothetical protein